ncbi:hypothetical protein G6027_00090 [Dietzia sp. SLG310A2-38A2]|uniref:hypothetical protein n=1 Tax=Dietzia sp. SLG310A2-38A2 TaxID=1630643 RepID=UPI0015F7990C|nr:hypothetical protein [Dietzia sp. SLG310A2-38A2]MBB1029310.1 hypothetical protein [Dietzia sp. SLG310A2-38A2]
MNEQYPPWPDDPSAVGRDHLPEVTDQFFPLERFPTERFPPEQFPTERFPTEQFPTRPAAGPVEPLAHEGGLPYGNPPAAAYRPAQDFVPQHLTAAPAFANSPYAPGQHQPHLPQHFVPQHFMPQPFMPQPYPMQQTVFVTNGGGRRVNHVLHLILTILTFGLWLPVWAVLAIANS